MHYSINFTFLLGPVVEELHQTINEWMSQVVRIYPEEQHIEFNWLVGSIPVEYYQFPLLLYNLHLYNTMFLR